MVGFLYRFGGVWFCLGVANPSPGNLFVSETAAEYGRKGRKVQMELNGAQVPDIRLIKARLIQIERTMRRADTEQKLDQCSRAYERMWRVYCWMCNIPAPGSRRPAPEPRKSRAASSEVEPALPDPLDVLRETE